MPFIAALSTAAETSRAIEETCQRASTLGEGQPDLVLTFFSLDHAPHAEQIAATLSQQFQPRCLIGCMGESIVGNDQEIEQQPALSLWLGRWPKPVQIDPFHLVVEKTSDGHSLMGWPDGL